MAKASTLVRFTPLIESSGGRPRSKPAEGGRRVYEGVTIIKAGLGNQRDKNYYPFQTLEANVNRFDGLRAYADHQDSLSEEVQPERTVRDLVGVYTNPRAVREGRDGGRVVADLHLFRSSKWLSDTVDDLIDLGQADKIGLSINGRGRTVERQIQLEEAADPINVNWVEDFLTLRSADVVTEAGAGGGFPQLLESARGSTQEKAMKLTEQQKAAIKAAVDAGDVDKLNALLKECGFTAEAAPAAPKGKAKAKTATAVEEAEDEADADADGADAEAEDELDAEAEDIVAEADEGAEETEDAEDVEEADDVEDAEQGDADDDDDVRESLATVRAKGAGVLTSGTAEGKFGRKIKGPKSSGTSAVRPSKGQGRAAQKGRRYAESGVECAELARRVDRLLEQNARLSAQLKVRTTADRAKNLLRESSIPRKMQPDVLRLMVGKSEDEMRRVVRYHERLIESAIEEQDGVEGAGTRFRESYHGSGGGDLTSVLDDVGLPTKES